MAETIETTPETNETIPEKEETIPEKMEIKPAAPEPTTDPAPKRRGRPKGAPDKAPRKKKITIIEEPIARPEAQSSQEAPAPPKPAPRPAPVHVHVPAPAPEPPSPRTTMREAARHILELQNLKNTMRKTYLQNAYTKDLHTL